MRKPLIRVGWLLIVALSLGADDVDNLAREKAALSQRQVYVGQWRGTGQPKRGSTQGSWRETCDWAWQFKDGSACLAFAVQDAKYYVAGELRVDEAGKEWDLTAHTKEQQQVVYSGAIDEQGTLVLTCTEPPAELPARVSIRTVADGDRLLVLFEKRVTADRYARLAEVGYTRVGSDFGKGTNYIECVVTGGVGTIEVTHEGKTYYVCCTGCRDYFNEHPAEVLAEYRERKAAERETAKTK